MLAQIMKRRSTAGGSTSMTSMGSQDTGTSRSRFSIFPASNRGAKRKPGAAAAAAAARSTPRDSILVDVHPLPVVHVNVTLQPCRASKPDENSEKDPQPTAGLPGLVVPKADTGIVATQPTGDDTCVTDLSSFDESHDGADTGVTSNTADVQAVGTDHNNLLKLLEAMAKQHTQQMEALAASLEDVATATASITSAVEIGRAAPPGGSSVALNIGIRPTY
mmetsp:Transcript_33350/g.94477  ORF Transcript_33350/g.94477 Transcript_33350/m.94477 type:complete len:220 (+) Transcript_33350:1-660(+)